MSAAVGTVVLVLMTSAWDGTVSLPLLDVGQGMRAAAMGEAYIGLAGDASAIYWNPAGLGQLSRFQLGLSHQQWFSGIKDEILLAALPVRRGAVGLNLVYSGDGMNELRRDETGQPEGYFSTWDGVAAAGYGIGLGGCCYMGGTVKALVRSLYTASSYGGAADFGILLRSGYGLGLGVVLRNLGVVSSGFQWDRLSMNAGIGASYSTTRFTGLVDVVMPFGVKPSVRFGLEFVPVRGVGLRLGYRTAPVDIATLGALSGLTGGFGIEVGQLGLGYVFSPYGKLGMTHRLGIQYAFGATAPAAKQQEKPGPGVQPSSEVAAKEPQLPEGPPPGPKPVGNLAKDNAGPILPPKLEAKAAFVEKGRRDSILSAGEEAFIAVTISNKGKGEARGLRIVADAICSASGVVVGGEQRIVSLSSGASDSVKISLRANENMKDQAMRFRVSIAESTLGVKVLPSVVAVSGKAPEGPDLWLYSTAINDGKGRHTKANGNGRLEAGEQVEITNGIINRGTGVARAVTITVAAPDTNTLLTTEGTFELGDIGVAEWRRIMYPISVAGRFPGKEVRLTLDIRERTGRFSHVDTVRIPLNRDLPDPSEVAVPPKTTQLTPGPTEQPPWTDNLLTGMPKGRPNPDAFAVIMGAADYRYMSSVKFAHEDAEAVRRYLSEVLGYADCNIVELLDPSRSDLERVFGTAGTRGRLYDWVSAKPGSCDVFIYYAGHGVPSGKEKEGYLVPVDANPDYIELQGYPLAAFYASIGRIAANSITVALDVCFSGEALVDEGKAATLLRDGSTVAVAPIPAHLPANVRVMSAAGAGQVASWYTPKRHGLFTYCLLSGLKGEADLNGDGTIRFGELETYVRNRVTSIARVSYHRVQTPEFRGDKDAKVVRLR